MKKIILFAVAFLFLQFFIGNNIDALAQAITTPPPPPASNAGAWGNGATDVNCDNLGWAGIISGHLGYSHAPNGEVKSWRRPHKPMSERDSNKNGNDPVLDWKVENKRHSREYGEVSEFTAFHQTAKCRSMTTYYYLERIFYVYAGLGLAGLALLAYIGKWEWKWLFSFIAGVFIVAAMQAIVFFLN